MLADGQEHPVHHGHAPIASFPDGRNAPCHSTVSGRVRRVASAYSSRAFSSTSSRSLVSTPP